MNQKLPQQTPMLSPRPGPGNDWPLIAETVWWYRRGQLDRDPIPALVTRSDRSGMLELSAFPPLARTIEAVSGVRYRWDPYLKTHPQVVHDNGFWDFVGGSPNEYLPLRPAETDASPRKSGGK